jgi:hypothetical protein
VEVRVATPPVAGDVIPVRPVVAALVVADSVDSVLLTVVVATVVATPVVVVLVA